jgi:MmyB-like transcription regulator ligand binding domain
MAGDGVTAARYPADRELKRLIAGLATHSPRFVELWKSGEVGAPQDQSRHKIIDHPNVGLIALDCDTLIVAGDDLRIMVYTAEPGTEDAELLALAVVLGTQALIGQGVPDTWWGPGPEAWAHVPVPDAV